MTPRRLGRPVLLLVLAALPLSGCTGSVHGPLEAELLEMVVHDPRNLTIRITVHNAGERPLLNVNALVVAHDVAPDGGVESGGGIVRDMPGVFRRNPNLFNDTDVLQPGERRNFTLRVTYPPEQSNVTEGEIYSMSFHAAYHDGDVRRVYNRGFPCLDASGAVRDGYGCDRRSSWERPR